MTVASLSFAAAACGSSAAPRWVSLAREGDAGASPPELSREKGWTTAEGRAVEFVSEEDGALWIEVALEPADWKPTGRKGVWKAPIPIQGLGEPDERLHGSPAIVGRAEFRREDVLQAHEEVLDPGTYHPYRGEMYLRLSPDVRPPAARIGVRVDVGARDREGTLWVRGRRYSGAGISVWPGSRVEREVDVSKGAALRFATCVERALVQDPPDARHAFRIAIDGEQVFEHFQELGERGSHARHALPLEAGRRRIAFEVDGPLAYTSFLDPVIGPTDVGRFGARPWPEPPSIVLFLADTFRADNLELYGGDPGIAPELNRFASESLRFARAWSVGTYTLPAHASLFSGLYPRQTATDAFAAALPDELETIAERLRASGYRTGAVTDSAVVSMCFGLHQGFEWFDEEQIDLASTLARARDFLDADDGRPVFLFVHTYRTHVPYRAVEDTPYRRGAPALKDAEDRQEFQALSREMSGILGKDGVPADEDRGRLMELVRALEELYRSGARDLDRGFARFRADLESRGIFASGWVLFTSDHGEAFLEHGELYHEGRVFEEQVRIPLLVHGPGIEPRTVELAASLVDLAPTLAAMARIDPNPSWLGTSLLALERDRTVFAFECGQGEGRSTVALVDGSKKLIGLEDHAERRLAEPLAAFDLAQDPLEQRDLLDAGEAWPELFFERTRKTVDLLLAPQVGQRASKLDEQRLEQLRALGYAAGE